MTAPNKFTTYLRRDDIGAFSTLHMQSVGGRGLISTDKNNYIKAEIKLWDDGTRSVHVELPDRNVLLSKKGTATRSGV